MSRLLNTALMAAWAVLALSLPGVRVHAGSIGVSPTLIDVKAGQAVSSLKVRNGSAGTPGSVQVRLMRWRQDDTGDVYTPAQGVAASPPVAQIAPGSEHLIRIVRTAAHPVTGEESYRLLLDQLPEPDTAQAGGVVSILIRHSVPVFFSTPAAAPARPQWQIGRTGTGGWRVTVTNDGDKRLRLANLALHDAEGVLVAERQGLVGYVLGGSRRSFEVKALAAQSAAAAALRLSVQAEAGSLETELLPVASP